MRYDVAVVGLGGMGAAALAHFARRGARAIGIDRYPRGHALGASTGETRVIRKAYFENPAYVPLLERAYELWHELQRRTRRQLLDPVGMLMVGEPEREGIAGTLRAAREYDLPLEVFDAVEIARRFPGTTPRAGEVGVFEPQAGIVFPEASLEAHLETAASDGAELQFDRQLAGLDRRNGATQLLLTDGTAIEAARIAIAAGMWTPQLLSELKLPLRIQRNVQIWFAPATRQFDCGSFPTFFVNRADLSAPLYGFPAIGGLLKAALHGFGGFVEPEQLERTVYDGDITSVRTALEAFLPGAGAVYDHGKVCSYALTPDGNFIVGRHRDDPSITIACGFSGHGYKFAPVIGEIVADLALDGGTRFDIGFLSPARFPASAV